MSAIKTPEIDVRDIIPVGAIIPWMGGYFGTGSNGSFANVLGSANSVAGAHGYLNEKGWYVCNGAALNDADSPIFNGASRYLPNLTDDRFLMGATVAGGIGGKNTLRDHTHTFSLTAAGQTLGTTNKTSGNQTVSHTHTQQPHYHRSAFAAGTVNATTTLTPSTQRSTTQPGPVTNETTAINNNQSASHTHTTDISHTHAASSVSGTVGTDSAAALTESRPNYLACFYIIKVK